MGELVLFFSCVALGAVVWHFSRGVHRVVLTFAAVLVTSLTATLISGEYCVSWLYLLLDLTESTVGIAAGAAILRFLPSPWTRFAANYAFWPSGRRANAGRRAM